MDLTKLDRINRADEGNFYDTRTMNFEMDRVAAMDDYGLTRVPGKWRFSAWQAFWSLTGLSTAMAYPLTGALLALSFGAPAVIIGFVITALIVGFGVYYTAKVSANEGISKDLLTRASLGYMGSVLPSLFSALFFILLFALEASVMARSLSEYLPILSYPVSAAIIVLVFIPVGIYGMVLINKLQNFTLWLYAIGIILAIVALFAGWSEQASAALAGRWWTLNPSGAPLSLETVLAATGAWSGAFGFVTILAVMDVTRMVRRNEQKKGAVLSTIISALFNSILIGLFGIFLLASTNGTNPDPGVTMVWLLGPFGLLLVLITQLRINVLNMYLGTLAFESSFAQVFRKALKRPLLLIPFAVIGYLVMITPFLEYFSLISSLAGAVFAAWVGAILGENLFVRRKYGIPAWKEFRRAYLPAVNWIGFASFIIPAVFGVLSVLGLFGPVLQAAGVVITFAVSFVMPVIVAALFGKEGVVRQFFARIPEIPPADADTMTCAISGETHHRSDFVYCPFHNGTWISSKACASEAKCGKMCQKSSVSSGPVQQVHA